MPEGLNVELVEFDLRVRHCERLHHVLRAVDGGGVELAAVLVEDVEALVHGGLDGGEVGVVREVRRRGVLDVGDDRVLLDDLDDGVFLDDLGRGVLDFGDDGVFLDDLGLVVLDVGDDRVLLDARVRGLRLLLDPVVILGLERLDELRELCAVECVD